MGYAENKIKRDWALMQFENGLGFGDGSDQMGCYIRAVKSLFFHSLIPFLSLLPNSFASLSVLSPSSPMGEWRLGVVRRGGRPS